MTNLAELQDPRLIGKNQLYFHIVAIAIGNLILKAIPFIII